MLSKNSKVMGRYLAITLMVIIMLFTASGCNEDDIDISSYADKTLTLTGIKDKDIVLTVADLKEMECETISTHSTSDKIGELKVTGPTLDTVLETYGVKQSDFQKIKFYGEDSYDITLYHNYLNQHEIYLAFGESGKPWDEESAPIRVIIPESDSAYWIRMLERIEFTK